MLIVTEAFHAAYPQFDPAALLTPDALAQAPILDQNCSRTSAGRIGARPTSRLHTVHSTSPRWRRSCTRTPPATGGPARRCSSCKEPPSSDNPQINTDLLVKKACAAGDTVDYRLYTGADHLRVFPAAASDVATWFADRVGGAPATSTCKAP